jgi:hypothetical protein
VGGTLLADRPEPQAVESTESPISHDQKVSALCRMCQYFHGVSFNDIRSHDDRRARIKDGGNGLSEGFSGNIGWAGRRGQTLEPCVFLCWMPGVHDVEARTDKTRVPSRPSQRLLGFRGGVYPNDHPVFLVRMRLSEPAFTASRVGQCNQTPGPLIERSIDALAMV